MVPTQVLAMQHKESLEEMLAPYGVKIGLLIGSMTAKEKREGKQKLAEGEWDVVVGTHAILQDNVEFADLALVITDEQHRFGVRQREKLMEKGDTRLPLYCMGIWICPSWTNFLPTVCPSKTVSWGPITAHRRTVL